MPKTRDPRFTFDFIGDSDRNLMVDGTRTNISVRKWSQGWFGVIEKSAMGDASWLDSWVSNGVTCFGRVRRWRSVEKAEDAAIELWLGRVDATMKDEA